MCERVPRLFFLSSCICIWNYTLQRNWKRELTKTNYKMQLTLVVNMVWIFRKCSLQYFNNFVRRIVFMIQLKKRFETTNVIPTVCNFKNKITVQLVFKILFILKFIYWWHYYYILMNLLLFLFHTISLYWEDISSNQNSCAL